MKVIHVATEFAHLAKAGGIADVLYGLAKEQLKMHVDVEIILPFYASIPTGILREVRIVSSSDQARCYRAYHEDVPFTLIDIPHLFDREHIYGYQDDAERFALFCREALSYLQGLSLQIDIAHLHDWPTALLALFLKKKEAPVKGTIFTLHNLQHQGLCSPSLLNKVGIEGKAYLPPSLLGDPTHPQLINLLKCGILFSDAINTVSPQYAKDILTPAYGYGLEGFLEKFSFKLSGILNGIDERYWSPVCDPFLQNHLAHPFSTHDLLLWKKLQRKELSERIGLKFASEQPLLVSITRLVEQKGPHLIAHALRTALDKGGQSVLLGSTHDAILQKKFESLEKGRKGRSNAHFHFVYDERLAHQLFAAADMIVIPSLFEPCGLTQMIAMRYGTVPIVRCTGGLKDTVEHRKNGFSFASFTTEDLDFALTEAFETFPKKGEWERLIQGGLCRHFNWQSAAKAYLQLYEMAQADRE